MMLRRTLVAAIVGWCGTAAVAAPVVPVLRGVFDPGNGQPLEALWGYVNSSATSVFISAGAQNFFNPAPMFRGQPTMFLPGTVYGAFVTSFDGSPLTWTLGGVSVTASGEDVSLPVDPGVLTVPGEIVPFVEGVWDYGLDDHVAVFGYASGLDTVAHVPFGSSNFMTPEPFSQGQPVDFLPGVVADAFVVHFTGPSLTWTLGYGGTTLTATADGNSPRLGSDPLPEPGSMAVIAVGAAVGGLGRRRGRGR